MGDQNSKRISKTLIPPEAIIPAANEGPKAETFEISTPKKSIDGSLTDPKAVKSTNEAIQTPDEGNFAVDLNIVNLESLSDVRLDDRAQSSPNYKDFGGDIDPERRAASTGNLAKGVGPENRMGSERQYSLDLGPTQDHLIVEIEQQRQRKANERKFKIIVGLTVFAILFTVTFFMVAWEMGYLKISNSFSTPVFY